MKKLTRFPLVLLLATVAFPGWASEPSCAARRAALESQIRIAERYDNDDKATALKQALTEINMYCTSRAVNPQAERQVRKLERQLIDNQEEINDILQARKHALQSGNTKTATALRKVLVRKKAEEKRIQTALEQARAELSLR